MNNQFISLAVAILLFVSIPTVAQEKTSDEKHITASIQSEILNEERDFWIQLPETYNPKSEEKYPVVFLLDGFSLKQNLQTVYNNYWGHYIPHVILVGISNRTNRTRDLTPTKIESRRGGPMNDESGGSANFRKFIAEELIPHIDSNYKTTNYRTLIGHSYGGLFVIETLIEQPELFKNYIAADPSLDWDNQVLLTLATDKNQNFTGRSLFISLAAEQLHMFDANVTVQNFREDTSEFTLFARSIADFTDLVEKSKDLNFGYKIYPEELHGTVPLPTMIDGLQFTFNWFQFKEPQKYNNPETTVEELEKLLLNQEKIYTKNYGYTAAPMVEELIIAYGYMNMQMGSPQKAELFFRNGVKFYPKSANANDSYGEFLESQEKFKEALRYAEKAFEISGSEYHKERVATLKSKIK